MEGGTMLSPGKQEFILGRALEREKFGLDLQDLLLRATNFLYPEDRWWWLFIHRSFFENKAVLS
jgi:hypothetical protein